MVARLLIRSHKVVPVLVATGLSLSLAGCGGMGDSLSRTFGFNRDSPDEFAVTTQAPLTLPPDYSIRPPRPGAPRPQTVPDQVAAQEALMPQTTLQATNTGMSRGRRRWSRSQDRRPPRTSGPRSRRSRDD